MNTSSGSTKAMVTGSRGVLTNQDPLAAIVYSATAKLLKYCRSNDWAGHDPYDALNSPLLKTLPLLDSRLPRLALTQALKRSPVSVRALLRIPKTRNAKAFGLFLVALLKLDRAGLLKERGLVEELIDGLAELRSPGTPFWCWGYSFPWQTRTLLVPRGFPNLVCTTFVALALLDAYEATGRRQCLEMAVSAAEYILQELYWSQNGDVAGFSYPLPAMRQQIHNANFLAAALFCRVSTLAGEKKFLEPALKAARFSAGKQRPDGSWVYGEKGKQGWVDNFHTGFNLGALRAIGQSLNTDEFEPHIRRGFAFYRANFFREDGAPNYFHNRTYPIDAHCVSQSIITLLEFKGLAPGSAELARSVFQWAMSNLSDPSGYFYYRVLPFCTIRTSYMRWVQAWMLLALATLCEEVALTAPAPVGVLEEIGSKGIK
jgi:hypothetical protein